MNLNEIYDKNGDCLYILLYEYVTKTVRFRTVNKPQTNSEPIKNKSKTNFFMPPKHQNTKLQCTVVLHQIIFFGALVF